MRSSVPPSASASSASVDESRGAASSSGSSSSTSTCHGQGTRASERLTCAAASKPSGAATAVSSVSATRDMRSTRNVRRSSRSWSCATRYHRPECTTRPCGLRWRSVSSPENERYRLRRRRPLRIASPSRSASSPATGAELVATLVKSSVASSASTCRRSASGRTRWIFASAPSTVPSELVSPRRPAAIAPSVTTTASSSVSISGGIRKPWSDPVAAPHAALALDRDAELLEPRDVPPAPCARRYRAGRRSRARS